MISLPCRPADSLQWTLPQDGTFLIRFELGLEDPYFSLDDELLFQSLSLALTRFSQEIWPKIQERAKGAILYQGSADFSAHFSWSERQRQNWDLWREENAYALDEPQLRRLFCADAFAHYFQLLARLLPDELLLHLLLDAAPLGSGAEAHQVLSRARFEHFQTAVQGLPSSNDLNWQGEQNGATIALCFPEDNYCSAALFSRLNEWMEKIGRPFRVIHEAFLTEEWEGVDTLYVMPTALSPQGERKLQGFRAAGGEVISLGDEK